MEEDDIKLLVKMNRWISVVPHNKKWKGIIWKFEDKAWRSLTKKGYITTQLKCYEWAARYNRKTIY